MINTKLQSIIDTKSAIGNAIVNKGGTITSETPFFNYAAQIDGISTGTPQTIFEASDGSKWALTNAVNLVNDAGNVTHDFNYWQPANNSTSDPILNVGTVGANISGNIRLVPVNQVNIAQYENIVINDTTGAKYVGYNGYDSQTNPTPTGNTTFNRWLLNNSATGTVVFANTTIVNGGTFNGSNAIINQGNMAFIGNTANYGGIIETITTNNGFIYVGGRTNQTIQKFYESNLAFVGNTPSYGAIPNALKVNNSFLYVGGFGNLLTQYGESNLSFITNFDYGGVIFSILTNNNFLFVGGSNFTIKRYGESNLTLLTTSANTVVNIKTMAINNGFIYVGGGSNFTIRKYGETNLTFIGNTNSYGGEVRNIAISNGFIYAAGESNQTVQKFHEGNLVFVGNTASYGGDVFSIKTNNGFIYAGGGTNQRVQKFYESNLSLVSSTNNYGGIIRAVQVNNGFIYAGGFTNQTVQKFQESQVVFDNQTFYTATKIKE
jgi:hypothetical protein